MGRWERGRSLTLHRDEILSEAGTELDAPLIQAAAVAVVSNPWTGTGPDEDLGPATEKLAPVLGKVLTDRLLLALGAPDRVEAFG
ncbi:amino acid synthesis family protein, partial [Mycobacterium tuberculosis]|nr:amino acid synthesis family protein [Mycobacterium tuberculosis]